MRVFLDANVLFSAAKSNGALRELLALLLAAGHVGVVDGFVLEEARRNLALKGMGGGAEALRQLAALATKLEVRPLQAHDISWPGLKVLPEKDQPILAAAIAFGCDALATGDRAHFGALWGKTHEGVEILSPRLLAERLLAESRPESKRSRRK